MITRPITILSPAGVPGDRRIAGAAPLRAGKRGGIALLSNSKPNVDLLFAGIDEALRALGYEDIRWFEKPTASRPVPEAMYDEIVGTCGAVVTARGD